MKTKIVSHTPTPWEVTESGNNIEVMRCDGKSVAIILEEPEQMENAAFIVKAVNCHGDYKEIAMYARALLKALEPRFMRTGCSETEQIAVKCLRQAIAKAEGK